MKGSCAACCLILVLVSVLRAAWAQPLLHELRECYSDCLLTGRSSACSCYDLLDSVDDDVLVKRSGQRFPFRFGKRESTLTKRQKIPFRYGKRSPLTVDDLLDSIRESANGYPLQSTSDESEA